MSKIDDARLVLAICGKCLGCGRLEIEKFRGTSACNNFKAAISKEVEIKKNKTERMILM